MAAGVCYVSIYLIHLVDQGDYAYAFDSLEIFTRSNSDRTRNILVWNNAWIHICSTETSLNEQAKVVKPEHWYQCPMWKSDNVIIFYELIRWIRVKIILLQNQVEMSQDHFRSSESDFICMCYPFFCSGWRERPCLLIVAILIEKYNGSPLLFCHIFARKVENVESLVATLLTKHTWEEFTVS